MQMTSYGKIIEGGTRTEDTDGFIVENYEEID